MDIFYKKAPFIQPAELNEALACDAGSRLCSAALDGKALNLTADALENAFEAPFDTLPDKTQYARYVMTPGTVYLGFDNGKAVAVRFAGGGAAYAAPVSSIPDTDTNVDLNGLFSSVIGQTVCSCTVSTTEEKAEYLCLDALKECQTFIDRVLISFDNGKTLAIYALLDYTIAGVLNGAEADMLRLKALRKCLL